MTSSKAKSSSSLRILGSSLVDSVAFLLDCPGEEDAAGTADAEDCFDRFPGDRDSTVVSSAADDVGGATPLGRELLPFLLCSVGVPPESSDPALFMLLIMSRTELLRLAAARAAAELGWEGFDPAAEGAAVVVEREAAAGSFLAAGTGAVSVLPATDVTSPDFRSTPTMDQGLGLVGGLGLG